MSSGEGGNEMTPCSINMSKVVDPNLNRNLPALSNICTQWLAYSTTMISHLELQATPNGLLNWPFPVPLEPN